MLLAYSLFQILAESALGVVIYLHHNLDDMDLFLTYGSLMPRPHISFGLQSLSRITKAHFLPFSFDSPHKKLFAKIKFHWEFFLEQ